MTVPATFDAGEIGIFGNGVTGKAVVGFCEKRSIGHKIFDEFGSPDEQFSEIFAAKYRTIVRSPSFTMSHRWVKMATAAGCRCMTELDLASYFWRGKIVAVTGTNGKTTTTEFISHALRSCGEIAVSCGNIGDTFIGAVDSAANRSDAWAIVEVSSFQMDGSDAFRPDYVLWTNFANNHLDVHRNVEEYFSCKANLVKNIRPCESPQTHCFVGKSVHDFCNRLRRGDILGKYSVCVSCDMLPPTSALNINPQRENFALVQKFWECINFPVEGLRAAAESFHLPPHRLQMVAKISAMDAISGHPKTVEFWNDSKATNFHALNAALGTFDGKVILIAGGKSKNEPMAEFLNAIRGRVRAILLMGESGEELSKLIAADAALGNGIVCELFRADNGAENLMHKIINRAFFLSKDGEIILLCPGFSSLDLFKNYAERGKFFENSILCLKLIYK
ncbi:MAG: UDP-N-acetylmuramoyl-L-alanine--D-glutamate ligase [Puniceicoccales bacterium]|jgi:UDP-N-acetylmuramoylalanine--D-glutamate ligase|nr:UDP-N-acetylmuramoyl-L-alanine--D-glutamate ligase [Puniceicoccales bacterium]